MKDLSENYISNDIDLKKSENNIFSENKQRKRRHSLPLKSFKVSSPAESQLLSKICDNIFEDVNIIQNNNPSMIDLGSKINLKKLFEDIKKKEENINNINNIINKENINNSKTFTPKEKENDDILEEDDDINRVRIHKKSYIFNNILKMKILKCPRMLEEQWKYEKILLDYNIIDFTSKQNIKLYI